MTSRLLRQFDRQERIDAQFPGMERQSFPELVRFVRPGPGTNFILYSRLRPETADETIRAQIEELRALDGPIEWKIYGHDQPLDFTHRLAEHDFVPDAPAPTLCLDLASLPPSLTPPADIDVRRLTDPAELGQVVAIEEEVWDEDSSWIYERFSLELQQPSYLEIFVAYIEDTPACAGWVQFQVGSEFASLWGGSTLEAFRGQGLYTAVLAARVAAADARGRRFVTVEAEPASERILLRHGFRAITSSSTSTWRP
jgi:GNAT superfamily N-acetyltransferase